MLGGSRMRIRVTLLSAVAIALLCVAHQAAAARWKHPGVAHPPLLALEQVYVPESENPDLSRGDITFTRDKTPRSLLSVEEIYIVAGARVSDYPDKRQLDPWASQVFRMILAYVVEHGEVPLVLDDRGIRSIPYYSQISDEELAVYRNPFTGEWPRLDAQNPSPGDMYVKVLNEAEKVEYARLLGLWEVWFGQGKGRRLCSPVFYQRVYGRNGPIYESLPTVTCYERTGPAPVAGQKG
jgi:hypothetical protein